jgi:hypothetical protein
LCVDVTGTAETTEATIQQMATGKHQRPRHNNGDFKTVGYPNPAGKYQSQAGNKKQKDAEAPVVSEPQTETADSQTDGRYYKHLLNIVSGKKT